MLLTWQPRGRPLTDFSVPTPIACSSAIRCERQSSGSCAYHHLVNPDCAACTHETDPRLFAFSHAALFRLRHANSAVGPVK